MGHAGCSYPTQEHETCRDCSEAAEDLVGVNLLRSSSGGGSGLDWWRPAWWRIPWRQGAMCIQDCPRAPHRTSSVTEDLRWTSTACPALRDWIVPSLCGCGWPPGRVRYTVTICAAVPPRQARKALQTPPGYAPSLVWPEHKCFHAEAVSHPSCRRNGWKALAA